jgi:hypothetical protein
LVLRAFASARAERDALLNECDTLRRALEQKGFTDGEEAASL